MRYIVGIDPSLRNTGMTMLGIADNGVPSVVYSTLIQTSGKDLTKVLGKIWFDARRFLNDCLVESSISETPMQVAIENFSRNSKFMREEMGMASGAMYLALHGALVSWDDIMTVSPRAGKVMACPDWHGLNKVNWEKSGRTTKFKRSMPDKVSVSSGLYRRYGLRYDTEHEADAAVIALAGVDKLGWQLKVCGYGKEKDSATKGT